MKRIVTVGLPRCGTTLVAAALNAQDRCTFMTDYAASFHSVSRRLRVAWKQPLSSMQRRTALAVVRDEFLRMRHPVLIRPEDFSTLDELHRGVLLELSGPGDRVVGHKVVLTPPQVLELLDRTEVHCVLAYRDPRDAALSYRYRTGEGVEQYLEMWRGMMRMQQEVGDHPRFHSIRFERLIANAGHELEPLCRALGLELNASDAPLVFRRGHSDLGVPWTDNSSFGDVAASFDPISIDRWKRTPRSALVRYAAWRCRSELERLGYEPSDTEPVSMRASFTARAAATSMDQLLSSAAQRLSRGVFRRLAQPLSGE